MSIHEVELQFDIFSALKRLARINPSVEVRTVVRGRELELEVRAGNTITSHIFNTDQLCNSRINVVNSVFDELVEAIEERRL